MAQKNMYADSVKQWSPFKGCEFDCLYCRPSFQGQAKRQKKNCMSCYRYEPHEHPKRLAEYLPPTPAGKFIFTCSSADIHFCSIEYFNKILERIASKPDRTFLLQSKDPKTFERVTFTDNVILGTTLETNRDELYHQTGMSKAPPPSQRFKDFLKIKHRRKQVTIEPVMDFDLDIMVSWMRRLKPVMVWIGYDSKNNKLPEPTFAVVRKLVDSIAQLGVKVTCKTIRIESLAEFDADGWTNWIKQHKPTGIWLNSAYKDIDSLPELERSKVKAVLSASKAVGIKKVKFKAMNGEQGRAVKSNEHKGNQPLKETNMSTNKKRAARLTAEQKSQLLASFAKTGNKAASAKELNVNYNQAYAFLTKHGGEMVAKDTVSKRSKDAAAPVGTAKTAREIHAAIVQMEQDLVGLRRQLGARLKVEAAELKKLSKAAGL